MADYMTLADLRSAINNAAGALTGKKENLTDYLINMVYLNELIGQGDPLYPWHWLTERNQTSWGYGPTDIDVITKANPGVIGTSSAHNLSAGDIFHVYGAGGMTEINGLLMEVASSTSDTITTNIDTTSFTTYTTGGKVYHRGITLGSSLKVGRLLKAGWEGYNDGMEIRPMTETEDDILFHNANNTAGPPKYCTFVRKMNAATGSSEQLIWHPATSGSFRLRFVYEKYVSRLAAAANVPLLPSSHHDAIVAGVITRLKEGSAESKVGVDNLTMWPVIYKSHIDALKEENRRFWKDAENSKVLHNYLF